MIKIFNWQSLMTESSERYQKSRNSFFKSNGFAKHLFLLLILNQAAQLVQSYTPPPCTVNRFPAGTGGTIGSTAYTAFDIDSNFNVVAGGSTTDTGGLCA